MPKPRSAPNPSTTDLPGRSPEACQSPAALPVLRRLPVPSPAACRGLAVFSRCGWIPEGVSSPRRAASDCSQPAAYAPAFTPPERIPEPSRCQRHDAAAHGPAYTPPERIPEPSRCQRPDAAAHGPAYAPSHVSPTFDRLITPHSARTRDCSPFPPRSHSYRKGTSSSSSSARAAAAGARWRAELAGLGVGLGRQTDEASMTRRYMHLSYM